MNEQKPIKQILGDGQTLNVNSIFYTIQGEGPFSGRPAIFIRLAGCNIQCSWCDTEYTKSRTLPVKTILAICQDAVDNRPCFKGKPLIVITGGEPFAQSIGALVASLYERDFTVQIETNGTLSNPDFPWGKCVVVCSPKTKKLHPDIVDNCFNFKYVIGEEDFKSEDGLPIRSTQGGGSAPARPPSHGTVWLSPRDDKSEIKNEINTETVVVLAKKFGYRVSLQTHKILNLE